MSNIYAEIVLPPTDGTIFLPDTLAFHRRYNPNASMYLFNEDGTDDIVEVSYSQLDRGCNRVVRAIGTDFDLSTRPVVALVALADTLLYQTIVVGMMSAGLIVSTFKVYLTCKADCISKPFPISPRNSAVAIAHLLRSTACHHILATCTTLKDLVAGIQEELLKTDPLYAIQFHEIPSLFQIFPELSDNPRLYELDAPVASLPVSSEHRHAELDDVALYLHSSGSTGFPKPIPKTHRNLLEYVLSRT
jgi:acyl-CoA synthetase (AMP-forming)/AMP-acid ligase II